jgi:hypothetical protein
MFEYLIAAIAAALLLAAAVYVHLRLPLFTDRTAKLVTAHAILLAVGLGCGLVGAQMYREQVASVLAFLIGFGVVHLPASAILFLKGLRGSGPS